MQRQQSIDTISTKGGRKANLAYGLSLIIACLFVYTVYHKITDMDNFVDGIARTLYFGQHAGAVAWSVLEAEVLVSLLLIWPDTNQAGLWGALGLLSAFTLYIISMLSFAEVLPCYCGGAIEKLTWEQHLAFNLVFMGFAIGLLLYHRITSTQILKK